MENKEILSDFKEPKSEKTKKLSEEEMKEILNSFSISLLDDKTITDIEGEKDLRW